MCMTNKLSILHSKVSRNVLQMIVLTQWMCRRFGVDEYQQTLPAHCLDKSMLL